MEDFHASRHYSRSAEWVNASLADQFISEYRTSLHEDVCNIFAVKFNLFLEVKRTVTDFVVPCFVFVFLFLVHLLYTEKLWGWVQAYIIQITL